MRKLITILTVLVLGSMAFAESAWDDIRNIYKAPSSAMKQEVSLASTEMVVNNEADRSLVYR